MRDPAGAQPGARADERLAPVFQLGLRQRRRVRQILRCAIVRVEQPTVAALDDRGRRRDPEPEITGLRVPADQSRTESEVILEPAVHGASVVDERPRRTEARRRRQLAVFGLRIGAVMAGDIGCERKREDRHERRDQNGIGGACARVGAGGAFRRVDHQNRK